MAISVGGRLPDATFLRLGAEGPEQVTLADVTKGRKLVIFAVPGAFTRTCSAAHLPSFVRTADGFKEKGVDEIICISVNDPFVLNAWADGAGAQAITMLADAEGGFTKAIGMDFNAPPVGLIGRSKRYSMLVEDGVVTQLNAEDSPGECDISAGETLLATL